MTRLELEIDLSGPSRGVARVRMSSRTESVEGPLLLDATESSEISDWFERLCAAETQDPPTPSADAVGARLFRALIHGPQERLWAHTRGFMDADPQARLRLVLRHTTPAPRTSPLLALPWELLFDPTTQAFVCGPRVSIVRRVDGEARVTAAARTPPLRVLAVWAQPPQERPLDLAHELARLDALCAHLRLPFAPRGLGGDAVSLRVCAHATPARLREALHAGPADILHFMGHGGRVHDEGALLFEAGDGSDAGQPVSGSLLAANLADVNLRLVVLNTCGPGGARAGSLRGVAPALVRGGVPAVLAMQAPIGDEAAVEFSEAFYTRLLAGEPIDTALHEARLRLRSAAPDLPEWAVPALYVRAPPLALFERRRFTVVEAALLAVELLVSAWFAFMLAFRFGPLRLQHRLDWALFVLMGLAALGLLALRWRWQAFVKRTRRIPPWWARLPVWLAGGASVRLWL